MTIYLFPQNKACVCLSYRCGLLRPAYSHQARLYQTPTNARLSRRHKSSRADHAACSRPRLPVHIAMKFLAVVVVFCGLQAAQAVPILGDDNALDIFDKEVTEVTDLQGVLRAIRNVITAIDDEIQKAINNFIAVVSKAAHGSEEVLQCVLNATAGARKALGQLNALGEQGKAFVYDAVAEARDCQQKPLPAATVCFVTIAPTLQLRGAELVGKASSIGVQVARHLAEEVDADSVRCVGAAMAARNQEAAGAGIIAGCREATPQV
ncbi:Poly [ADP-ribose] polymerase [Frankliniella fusca]|uniref:Poly [ADP-ribose] polymerase n=1 Tax=Frankliniella fusca TaxID=407009 RepID=A0AAE1H4F3_9NEOP|nr:Poly [ADP-ribose] polymerase [Frankliniella fusca]